MRLHIPLADIEIKAIRSQGPGGQNVNKVASAVQLRFDVRASSLPEPVKARLLALQDGRISQEGVLVIKAQAHRTQDMNKADALARLSAVVNAVARPPTVRHATKPTHGSQLRRLDGKKKRASLKSMRGPVTW